MLPWRLLRRKYQRPAAAAGAAFVVLFVFYRLIIASSRVDDDEPMQPRLPGVTVLPGPLLNHHLYFSLIDNTAVCGSRGDRPVHFLLFVMSRPGHFEQRRMLRDYYSSDVVVAAWRPRVVRILFIVAVDIADESLQARVYDESSAHRDIIQEEYADDERVGAEASRLTMTAIKWALTRCTAARFIIRTSDTVLVNPMRLVAVLASQFGDAQLAHQAGEGSGTGLEKAIVCRISVSRQADRDPAHARHVPVEAYSEPWLPEHCHGGAYVLTYEMAKHLFVAYQHTAYVRHEAAYVTGILRRAAGRGARLLPIPAAADGSSADLGALQSPPGKGAAHVVLGSPYVFLSVPLANVTDPMTPKNTQPRHASY